MPIYNLTQDKIDEFEKHFQDRQNTYQTLEGKNDIQLWREDLDEVSKIFKIPKKMKFKIK
jgi:heme-degrading monooxygenase HmoA